MLKLQAQQSLAVFEISGIDERSECRLRQKATLVDGQVVCLNEARGTMLPLWAMRKPP